MDKQKEAKHLGYLFLVMLILDFFLPTGLMLITSSEAFLQVNTYLDIIFCVLRVELVCVFLILKKEDLLQNLNIRKIRWSTVFYVFLLGIVSRPLFTLANLFSQLFVKNVFIDLPEQMITENAAILFLYMVILAPVGEEVVFRGVFQQRYKKVTGTLKAVLLSAFLFGLFHMNLNQFCYATVMGVIFGLVNEASGSIIPSMLLHIGTNFTSTSLALLVGWLMKNSEIFSEGLSTDVRQVTLTDVGSRVIPAVISLILIILMLRLIAKNEGNEEYFHNIFRRKKKQMVPFKAEEPLVEMQPVWEKEQETGGEVEVLVYEGTWKEEPKEELFMEEKEEYASVFTGALVVAIGIIVLMMLAEMLV